uniref:Uncharacterized protein n=1 Tax=Rhizophora mucronata TaxID=61149 RepID=A0A2P2MY38_RHIMU
MWEPYALRRPNRTNQMFLGLSNLKNS